MNAYDMRRAYRAILAQMSATVTALAAAGIDPRAAAVVATCVGLASSQIAQWFFGNRGGGSGGPAGPTAVATA